MQYEIVLNRILCSSSMVFFRTPVFYLFLLKCSDTYLCSLRLIIFWNKNWKMIELPMQIYNQQRHLGDYWKLFKMKIYDAVFVSLLVTSKKCHRLLSCVLCQLLAFFACKTFDPIQHCFNKTNIFHIFWFFNSHFLFYSDCTRVNPNAWDTVWRVYFSKATSYLCCELYKQNTEVKLTITQSLKVVNN